MYFVVHELTLNQVRGPVCAARTFPKTRKAGLALIVLLLTTTSSDVSAVPDPGLARWLETYCALPAQNLKAKPPETGFVPTWTWTLTSDSRLQAWCESRQRVGATEAETPGVPFLFPYPRVMPFSSGAFSFDHEGCPAETVEKAKLAFGRDARVSADVCLFWGENTDLVVSHGLLGGSLQLHAGEATMKEYVDAVCAAGAAGDRDWWDAGRFHRMVDRWSIDIPQRHAFELVLFQKWSTFGSSAAGVGQPRLRRTLLFNSKIAPNTARAQTDNVPVYRQTSQELTVAVPGDRASDNESSFTVRADEATSRDAPVDIMGWPSHLGSWVANSEYDIFCAYPWFPVIERPAPGNRDPIIRYCYNINDGDIDKVVLSDDKNRVRSVGFTIQPRDLDVTSPHPAAMYQPLFSLAAEYYPVFEYGDRRPPFAATARWLEMSFEYIADEEAPSVATVSVDGVRHGMTMWFDRDMRVVSVADYYDGARHGLSVRFDEKGNAQNWQWYIYGQEVMHGKPR